MLKFLCCAIGRPPPLGYVSREGKAATLAAEVVGFAGVQGLPVAKASQWAGEWGWALGSVLVPGWVLGVELLTLLGAVLVWDGDDPVESGAADGVLQLQWGWVPGWG